MRVRVAGFRVQDFMGLRCCMVQGQDEKDNMCEDPYTDGFRVQGSELGAQGSGFRARGAGSRVQGHLHL